jgi:hypothetical protein
MDDLSVYFPDESEVVTPYGKGTVIGHMDGKILVEDSHGINMFDKSELSKVQHGLS